MIITKRLHRPDCNRCSPFKKCNGRAPYQEVGCPHFLPPREGWQFAELLLAHPQSTHDTLVGLPFEVNLEFHLRGGGR